MKTIETGYVSKSASGKDIIMQHTQSKATTYMPHNCRNPRNCNTASKITHAARAMGALIRTRHIGGELELYRIR